MLASRHYLDIFLMNKGSSNLETHDANISHAVKPSESYMKRANFAVEALLYGISNILQRRQKITYKHVVQGWDIARINMVFHDFPILWKRRVLMLVAVDGDAQDLFHSFSFPVYAYFVPGGHVHVFSRTLLKSC